MIPQKAISFNQNLRFFMEIENKKIMNINSLM